MIRPYKIGKKVGVIRFNMSKNSDYIDCGKVVARRYMQPVIGGSVTQYAVEFDDGKIEVYDHENLWPIRRLR